MSGTPKDTAWLGGHYLDRLEQRGNGLRIAERTFFGTR